MTRLFLPRDGDWTGIEAPNGGSSSPNGGSSSLNGGSSSPNEPGWGSVDLTAVHYGGLKMTLL